MWSPSEMADPPPHHSIPIIFLVLSVMSFTTAANMPLNFLTRFMKGRGSRLLSPEELSKTMSLYEDYDGFDPLPLAMYNKVNIKIS